MKTLKKFITYKRMYNDDKIDLKTRKWKKLKAAIKYAKHDANKQNFSSCVVKYVYKGTEDLVYSINDIGKQYFNIDKYFNMLLNE